VGQLKPPFHILASLRLAIFIIISMAVIAAVGTITEARYDAEVAQKLVYQSIYMYSVLGLLIFTLIAVMVDRWPWKQHHTGFVLAHIGIILLLGGAYLTQKVGIDGSIGFAIGETRKELVIKDQQLAVYSSLDGNGMSEMFSSSVDFLRHPPSADRPFVIGLGSDEIKVTEYEQFAFREAETSDSGQMSDGPAIRFQLENPNVNLTQWLRREGRQPSAEIDLGPAKVIFTNQIPAPMGRNAVVLVASKAANALDYVIYNKDNTVRKKGVVHQSETVETGWMGMKFRLLRYIPHAKEVVTYRQSPTASPLSNPAIHFSFRGTGYWLGLDSAVRVFLPDRMFLISYGHRQVPLGFPLTLKDFRVGMYQGTDRAASYESLVQIPGGHDVVISMNEPLKYNGYTFYQSSFERDERTGKPAISILSVNYDPGRWIKYLGSMLMVLGSIILFYFKRVQWLKSR
jgi:hypothetical protein